MIHAFVSRLAADVERKQILAELLELAREAGIRVRESAPGEPLRSGACRVRGEAWLVIAPGDPLEDRIAVVVSALRGEGAALLESRYLPPALRELLEG